MAIKIVLPVGTCAVYGAGAEGILPSGNVLPKNYRYGTVYNIAAGLAPFVYGGDIIYWKEGEQIVRIVTGNALTYTIVPARLAIKDTGEDAP